MNKIIASAGMLAVGTAGLQAANTVDLGRQETTKPWSVSAALRAFYDDNYATVPSSLKEGSAGIQFRPGIAYNLPLDQTQIRLSYTYDLRYFFDREGDDTDQAHEFLAKLDHRFSERYRLKVSDSFVYSSEPEVLDPSGNSTLRTKADGMRNLGSIDLIAQITELVSTEIGYANWFYEYFDDGPGSRSAMLDRMVHMIHIDGRYQIREHTLGLLGYQYGIVDYTGNDPLWAGFSEKGDYRNNTSHYVYVGADHSFSSTFSGTLRAGVQYTEYDNDVSDSTLSPYLDLQATYVYLPGSYVQLGARIMRTPTDIVGPNPDELTTDADSGSIYANVKHRFTQNITGTLLGQYQVSRFNGGIYDGDLENFFVAGANLEYRINRWWSVDVGYNFDRVDSDIANRSFSRNRVYGGVLARY